MAQVGKVGWRQMHFCFRVITCLNCLLLSLKSTNLLLMLYANLIFTFFTMGATALSSAPKYFRRRIPNAENMISIRLLPRSATLGPAVSQQVSSSPPPQSPDTSILLPVLLNPNLANQKKATSKLMIDLVELIYSQPQIQSSREFQQVDLLWGDAERKIILSNLQTRIYINSSDILFSLLTFLIQDRKFNLVRFPK